jgi:hypothetical protein
VTPTWIARSPPQGRGTRWKLIEMTNPEPFDRDQLDGLLQELLELDEQWPPVGETDQERIEGVRQFLYHGIEAAKIGLGITSATRLEDGTYLMVGQLLEDCPTCQTLRSYVQAAAVHALVAAGQLATVYDPHTPEFDDQIMPVLEKISTYEDAFRELHTSHQGAHQ